MKSIILALTILFTGSVQAMNVTQYEKFIVEYEAETQYYIHGVGVGLHALSVVGELKGNKPLLCIPSKLIVNMYNHISILEDQIAIMKGQGIDMDTMELSVVLFWGLERTFPCNPV